MEKVKFIFAVVSVTGGAAFNHGFHTGLVNVLFSIIIDWYKNLLVEREWQWEDALDGLILGPFILAAFPLGGVIGSLLIWFSASLCGRKAALLCASAIVLSTLILISFAYLSHSYEVFVIGRLLLGISAGLGSGIAPMYLVEIAPDVIRGAVGSFYYVMVAGSIALAYVLCLPGALGSEGSWPLIFVICLLPTCIQVFTLIFCPESPKFLMFDREDENSAEDALAWLQGDDIDDELDDLREEAAVLQEIGPIDFVRLYNDQIIRSPLIIATVIMFGQQTCGIDGMLYFSTVIFSDLGYDHDAAINCTIGLGVCNFIASVICMVLVDKVGRKPLLMGSFAGMIFSSVVLALLIALTSYTDEIPPEVTHVAVVFFYIYVITYALGAGTIPWFYAAEICNHYARPLTMTIALTISWIVHFLVVMTFLPLKIYTGNYVFMVYVIFDIFILLFVFLTMRETMELMAVDITELFYD